MSNSLPPSIASYFSAKESGDVAALDSCLSLDVVVRDPGENTEVHGIAGVKEWMLQTRRKFALSTEVVGSRISGGVITVDTMVSGDFPGSPLPFAYHFSLDNGKIASIDIRQSV